MGEQLAVPYPGSPSTGRKKSIDEKVSFSLISMVA